MKLQGLALASLALLAGCRSTYHSARYGPSPVAAIVGPEGRDDALARVLATVRGIRRARDGAPAQVELRMRFENLGSLPFGVPAESLELLSADLESLGAPRCEPPLPTALGPGESASSDVAFVLAKDADPDDHDLSGLNLRWTLRFTDGIATTGSMTFERLVPVYDDDPHVGFGFGVGYIHH